MKDMKLRTIALFLFGSLSVLSIAASLALITSTTALHQTSTFLLSAGNSIRASQELESNVLKHSRASMLWLLTGDEAYLTLMRKKQTDVEHWLSEARLLVNTAEEGLVLNQAESAINDYSNAVLQLDRKGASPQTTILQLLDKAALANEQIKRFSDINQLQSREAHAAAVRYDALANWIAWVVLGLVALSVLALIFILRRYVYRPILELNQSIQNFRMGKNIDPPTVAATELTDISTSFKEMTDELRQRRQNQMRYLAAVAHDLRNPLAAIKMSLDLMGDEENLSSEGREMLGVVDRQASHLDRMVGDLLDTTRGEEGRLELRLKRCDLTAEIKGCCDLFRSYSKNHTVLFNGPEFPVYAHVDARRISQVVNNLISNAIKYSPLGGKVEVTVEVRATQILIAVKDEGVGLSAEECDMIFEPYRRAPSTKNTIPGVGLGLFTAKKIVLAHGGEIRVHSTKGSGTTFVVFLPRNGDKA